MDKLRLRIIAKELNGTISYRNQTSQQIEKKIYTSKPYKKAEMIFVYVNKKDEVETTEIIAHALKDGKRICVPKCIDKENMIAVEIHDIKECKKGFFGIKEPESDIAVDKSEIDLAIVPCVAASTKCQRVGHGNGYYDRYLQDTSFTKIGLCYQLLIVNSFDTEENDVDMDYIVTESFIYKRPSQDIEKEATE